MSKTLIDASDVMRKAVFRIDDGWYDAYWFSERPDRKPHILSTVVVRQLVNAIAAVRICPLGWPARRNTAAVTRTREDLLAAGKG
jgi:hypothetical protein